MLLALELFAFGLAWWLGLYLVARNPRRPLLRRAAAGLLAYALALGLGALEASLGPPLAPVLARLRVALVTLPALCWAGALILLLPEEAPYRRLLDRGWRFALVPLVLLAAGLQLLGALPEGTGAAVALLVMLPLGVGLVLVAHAIWSRRPARGLWLIAIAVLFSGLSSGLIIALLGLLPPILATLAIGFDLICLGLAIAWADAFDDRETLRPHLARSGVAAAVAAVLFAVPGAVAIVLEPAAGAVLKALIFATIALAIAAQTLADPLAGLLDNLAFARAPNLRSQRTVLRDVAAALPRVPEALDPGLLDETAFARLVRRALSHYGDLGHLAASPLTRLPLVSARLAARQAPDSALERADELKALLGEAISRLKPRAEGAFGTSDEWRLYNALYFPYVVGLRPYSQRGPRPTEPESRAALDWFQAQVPERTLYNWQNAAARLVAEELRRQNRAN